MVDSLDVFDFIKRQVKDCQVGEILKSPYVRDEIIVKIKLSKGRGEMREPFDFCDGVLAEAEAFHGGETIEFEGG